MKSLYKRLVAVVLALVSLLCIGGVSAAWVYADGPIAPIQQLLDIGIWFWTETPGGDQGDMTIDEAVLTNNFIDIFKNTEEYTSSDGTKYASKQEYFEDEVVGPRTQNNSFWYVTNEVSEDESPELRELFGIEEDSDLSVIIKFVYGEASWFGTPPLEGYELYTTRINLYEKKDLNNDGVVADNEYVIPDSAFTTENYYIYPVNKTTFTYNESASGVEITGADTITVGYSRCIQYYENGEAQAGSRSFDVSQWKEGTESDAVLLDDNNKEYFIYSDIGQVQQTVYFRYGNLAANGNFTGANFPAVTATTPSVSSVTTQAVDSRYKFTRGVGGNNQYATLTYTPSGEDPSPTNPHAIKITLTT